MIKKFFVAMILGLLVMNSQIAFATWSSIRNFNSKSDLARWIEAGRRKGQTEFNFTLTNMSVTAEEISNEIAIDAGGRGGFVSGHFTYIVNELPGTRVANAYLSGDKSKLTAEELQLYNVAVTIVNEAKSKYGTPKADELYFHNEICKRATPISVGDKNRYYPDGNGDYVRDKNGNRKMNPSCTAIGALINGKANCSGYSDAFYMLCRMRNLNVVRVGGRQIGGNGHAWNAIKFSGIEGWSGLDDGKVYFVDVLWDDQEGNYSTRFFNQSEEVFRQEHSWNYVGL